MRIPSHSTIIACMAFGVAVSGGVGYAAATLPANSVGSAQIRNGSIRTSDLAKSAKPPTKARIASVVEDVVTDPNTGINITVKGEKGDKGEVGPQGAAQSIVGPQGPQGTQGAQGVQGPQGDAGGSWGYAKVNANGTATAGGLVVSRESAGMYCVDAVLPHHVAVATPEGDGATSRTVAVQLNPGVGQACDGHDVLVATAQSGSSADVPFYVMVN